MNRRNLLICSQEHATPTTEPAQIAIIQSEIEGQNEITQKLAQAYLARKRRQQKAFLKDSNEEQSQKVLEAPDELPFPPKKTKKRLKRCPIPLFDPLYVQHQPVCTTEFEYEQKCSICLEQISERTQPNSCSHIFCMECIFGWTRYSNVCPLCKKQMTHLNRFDPLQPGLISERIEVKEPDKDEMNDFVNEFADRCYMCLTSFEDPEDEDRSLIVCDECNFQVVHYQCLQLKTVPVEEWFCMQCVQARVRIKKTERKFRRKVKKQKILFETESNQSEAEAAETIDIVKQLRSRNDIYGDDTDEERRSPKKVSTQSSCTEDEQCKSRSVSQQIVKKRVEKGQVKQSFEIKYEPKLSVQQNLVSNIRNRGAAPIVKRQTFQDSLMQCYLGYTKTQLNSHRDRLLKRPQVNNGRILDRPTIDTSILASSIQSQKTKAAIQKSKSAQVILKSCLRPPNKT